MLYLGKTGQWQFSAKNLARRKSQRRCGIQSPHTVREKSKLSDFLKRKENGCFLPMPKGRSIRSLVFDDGVYPYVYNMAAVAGMRVRENGETYVCTRDIDPLLYPPSQVAAHFTKE